jgi:hypothetical protein
MGGGLISGLRSNNCRPRARSLFKFVRNWGHNEITTVLYSTTSSGTRPLHSRESTLLVASFMKQSVSFSRSRHV